MIQIVIRPQWLKQQIVLADSERFNRGMTNREVIPTKRIKLISLSAALATGVLKYLAKVPQVMNVRTSPTAEKTATSTPLTLFICIRSIGKSTQRVRSSFDFCVCEHSVQLRELWRVLMLPSGHLIHFQQQGVVSDCLVPGEQSLAQIDRGALWFKSVFHTTFDFSVSCGFLSFIQDPTKTFSYFFSRCLFRWKLMIS